MATTEAEHRDTRSDVPYWRLARMIMVLLCISAINMGRAAETYAGSFGAKAPPPKVYSDDNLGLSLSYPAAWVVKPGLKASTLLSRAAPLAHFLPGATVLYSPDGLAFVVVATRNGDLKPALFEKIAMAIVTDGARVTGSVQFQEGDNVVTINDQDYARADATIVDPQGRPFAATVTSTLDGDTTVIFVAGVQLKKPASKQHIAEREALFNSIVFN